MTHKFSPGDEVPRAGIYRVVHYAHRVPHLVSIQAEGVFPPCRRCGDKVRFEPLAEAEGAPLTSDVDFIGSTGQAAS